MTLAVVPFAQETELVEINSVTTVELSGPKSTPPASFWMKLRPVLVGHLAVLHA